MLGKDGEKNPYAPPLSDVDATSEKAKIIVLEGEPSGIGGWLLVPLLGIILTPIRVGFDVYRDLLPAFTPVVWSRITNPAADSYHPFTAPLIVFELIANIGIILLSLYLLRQFLKKSTGVPRLYIVFYSSLVAIQVIDLVFAAQIPSIASGINAEMTKDLVKSVISAVIWIPYFLVSKRVKNTFVVET